MRNNDWQLKSLGEIIRLEYGKPLADSKRKADGAYPIYGANGVIDRTDEYYYDKKSIIVGRKGSAGETNIAEDRFWPLDVTYFTVFDENKYDLMFLFYLLTKLELRNLARGVKPGINRNDVYSIKVRIPSLCEQKRIVAILDKAFAAIDKAKENTEKNLANAHELFESFLQSAFSNPDNGWEQKSLGELGTITSSKRVFKSEYVKVGVPFYRTKEIKELAHGKDISTELFISKKRYDEIKVNYGIPKAGDILLSAVGTIGEIYVVQENDKFYFKDGNIVWLKDFNSIDACYLRYALMSFVEPIKTLSRGAAYSALTIEKLKKYMVPIASIEEQQSIVSKLDELSVEKAKIENVYQQKLSNLDELKKAILRKAFEGGL